MAEIRERLPRIPTRFMAMHAALDVNIPNYASALVTTDEIIDSISSLSEAVSPVSPQPVTMRLNERLEL